jgi:hypothetical protein
VAGQHLSLNCSSLAFFLSERTQSRS